ncbi:MAG: N4-gp56 family major capsid protein [Bacillota bacterium]|nr:N4-gp56 family major capsid protein [Bacillota bacterium]
MTLASKYSGVIDEQFKLGSLTQAAVSTDFEWIGVNTIAAYSIETSGMNDYSFGTTLWPMVQGRFGNVNELGQTVQYMTVMKDRSFTFTIDAKNDQDTQGAMKAKNALKQQMDVVVIPEVDKYRLSVMSASAIANGQSTTAAITTDNAYSSLLNGIKAQDENKVPIMDRIAYVTPDFYLKLKQDNMFVGASFVGKRQMINGQVGLLDFTRIVKVPTDYLPANHAFILCHPKATIAAEKLASYKIQESAPNISGSLVEGRIIYDCFVSDNKKQALYVHKIA